MRRELQAVNTAPESENRMHGDEARRYGFSSGLVPGIDVLAYLAHEAVDQWGPVWLDGGRLQGWLDRPVYDGEVVAVVREDDGEDLSVRVEGASGDGRARARLSLIGERPASHPVPSAELPGRAEVLAAADAARFPVRSIPEPSARPAASCELLVPGTVLGTQRARFHADRAPAYLDEISESHPVFRSAGCAHPGWLLRFANWALSSTVRLGPWIHVSSDARFLAPVRDGDELEVRAVVTDRFERKGHELVDLDVLYLVADTPVAFVEHRAIWQPRVTSVAGEEHAS